MWSIQGDIRLFYERGGDGPPLLLLHGNGEDHHIFDPLRKKLEKHYTVYAVDSRNHGQSSRTQVYTYDAMAGDIDAFIGALGIGPVYLVGFSDGAIIGLLLAMRHPQAVARMALLGINLSPEDFTETCYREMAEDFARTGDPLLGMMLTQPDITLQQTKAVDVPTLLIAGERDVIRPEVFSALAQAMPQASLMTLPGHDHDSYIVGQDLLYADLVAFFGR